ncbi:hypothetical protein [Paraburkholderia youngii]|uniref:hypothetical protein n=1 Tax=Paraburkholderia youngii TaxID=2782701 RepID=UPI003D1E0399
MSPWVEAHLMLLRDLDVPLTAEQRINIARLLEQSDTLLAERTKALHAIGYLVGAGPGCDLVRELPSVVAAVIKDNGGM